MIKTPEPTAPIPNALKVIIAIFAICLPIGVAIFMLTYFVFGEPLPKATYRKKTYSLSISGNPPVFEFNQGKGLQIKQFEGFQISELDTDYRIVEIVWLIRSMNQECSLPYLEYGKLPKNWTQLEEAKILKPNSVYGIDGEYCFKRKTDGSFEVFESPLTKQK